MTQSMMGSCRVGITLWKILWSDIKQVRSIFLFSFPIDTSLLTVLSCLCSGYPRRYIYFSFFFFFNVYQNFHYPNTLGNIFNLTQQCQLNCIDSAWFLFVKLSWMKFQTPLKTIHTTNIYLQNISPVSLHRWIMH